MAPKYDKLLSVLLIMIHLSIIREHKELKGFQDGQVLKDRKDKVVDQVLEGPEV